MRAIILAAGRGSRMKRLTESKPKCLVELRGKPLLDWQLEALYAGGITEVGIVTGYKRELLSIRGLVEFFNPRWTETNMVTSLSCAGPWLQETPCIVCYSDIFFSAAAVKSLLKIQDPIALTYDPNWLGLWKDRFGDPLLDAETFRLNADKSLAEIGKKPHSVFEVEGQYMGLLRFTPIGWSAVTKIRSALTGKENDVMHMTHMLQKIIEARLLRIAAIPVHDECGEIDSQEDLELYQTRR
jgi:choline kinase